MMTLRDGGLEGGVAPSGMRHDPVDRAVRGRGVIAGMLRSAPSLSAVRGRVPLVDKE